MTIDDLKTMDKTDLMYALDELGDEILALVDACQNKEPCDYPEDLAARVSDAMDAFNAKMESLHV